MKYLEVAVLSGMCALAALAQSPGKFVATGEMTTHRVGHTATLLKDGRVLITGGQYDTLGPAPSLLASAEIYDPSTRTFSPTGDMTTTRMLHSATLLSDGRVLIAGGLRYVNSTPRLATSSEVYDPATGLFTKSGDMNTVQGSHAANLLGNGKVLITGDLTAELYDPATGIFTLASPGSSYRSGSTVLLQDGRVLIIAADSISLYDVVSNSLRLVTRVPGSYALGTTTLLSNGKILISGGEGVALDATLNEASLYNPRTATLDGTGLMLFSRSGHSATLLPGGHVLIVGGYDGDFYDTGIPMLTDAEDYDPSTGSFTSAGPLVRIRENHTATLLTDGSVLIAGGTFDSHATAELYIPPLRAGSSASLSGPLASESQASLFGSRLAATTESADPHSPPTSLGGISLRVVDSSGTPRLAPLFYVSPTQINFEVPVGTATGNVTLEVLNAPTQLPQAAARVDNIAPALFTREDNTVVAYIPLVEPHRIRSADRPVQLILHATGIRSRSSLANVQCTIGGISVPVEYAGPNDNGVAGLDQVTLRLTPTLKGGFADLVLTVDGIPSNTLSVFIPNPRPE